MTNGTSSFAPCPADRPSGTPPSRKAVKVVINSVRLKSDMEGDDDYVPFYDNRADVYGRVTIEGQVFDLPELTDNNNPSWDPQDGTFVADVTANPVPIRIELFEADEGLTGSDDEVDINPVDGKSRLDLQFDTCSLLLGGDLPGKTTQRPVESSGSGSSGGTIRFTVGTLDGTPDTVNDVAIVELGLVQVIHQPSRLVAGKPTIIMARVANNATTPVETTLRVQIFAPGMQFDEDFPMSLAAGELKKAYFRQDNPIVLPFQGTPYTLNMTASVVDPFSKNLPSSDCRRVNDSVPRSDPVRVVRTRTPTLMWAKVGTGLDIGNYTPDAHFHEIIELGKPFIEATYPVSHIDWQVSPFPLSPPISTVHDWMTAILDFLPYARSLDPFALVFELNLISVLSGNNVDMTILGVLPSHDWFSRYDGWERKYGVSMGEFAPHAVIFQPRSQEKEGAVPGPQMTLPAHELGHTFNLSVDSRLKHSWVCDVDWPVVGSLPCGARGGLDEYKHDDPLLKEGNPASGYWVQQGGEPPSVAALANKEQCDSHCFMGGSRVNTHLNWSSRRRWIDRADYEHLINKLALGNQIFQRSQEPGAALHVSGLIAWNDEMYVGPMALCEGATPDRTTHEGLYAVRFLDRRGQPISEVGLPINWNHADYSRAFPITAFSTTIPFQPKADAVEFVNRGTGKRLAKRRIRRSAGLVSITAPGPDVRVDRGTCLALEWSVKSGTGKKTRSTVLVSPDRKTWWPASASTNSQSHRLDTAVLEPGTYLYKVAVLDGIDVLTSNVAQFSVT